MPDQRTCQHCNQEIFYQKMGVTRLGYWRSSESGSHCLKAGPAGTHTPAAPVAMPAAPEPSKPLDEWPDLAMFVPHKFGGVDVIVGGFSFRAKDRPEGITRLRKYLLRQMVTVLPSQVPPEQQLENIKRGIKEICPPPITVEELAALFRRVEFWQCDSVELARALKSDPSLKGRAL